MVLLIRYLLTVKTETGPRKTAIGDNYLDVVNKYPIGDRHFFDDIQEVLYNTSGEDYLASGTMVYDENGNAKYALYFYYAGDHGYCIDYSFEKDIVDSFFAYANNNPYFE